MKKKDILLHCSEETFYEIANQTWAYCTEQQGAFAAYRNKYTTEFITYAKQQVEAASAMLNCAERRVVIEKAKCVLMAANQRSKKFCLDLFVYIGRSFPKDEVGYMCREAGSSYYAMASNDSWRGTGAMLLMSVNFIKQYAPELAASNMPDTFFDNLCDAREAFEHALCQYTNAKDNLAKGSEKKKEANNKVFTELQKVMKDGKAIFRNDPALKQYFTFKPVMKALAGYSNTNFPFVLQQKNMQYPVSKVAVV